MVAQIKVERKIPVITFNKMGQGEILKMLKINKKMSAKELAAVIGVSSGSVNRAIRSLRKANEVEIKDYFDRGLKGGVIPLYGLK